jgi:hypothetical protein
MAKETITEKAAEKIALARKKNLDLAITHIQKEFGEEGETSIEFYVSW